MRSKLLSLVFITSCAACVFAATVPCRETLKADGNLQTTESRRGRDRAFFHVRVDRRPDGTVGRLDYRDRGQDVSFKSTSLTLYEIIDSDTRRLTFDLGTGGDTNSGPSTVLVTLRDLGRRGRTDFFEISAGGYLASGNLKGGNIRLMSRGDCDNVVSAFR